ncbi:MAG TPA: hypothetical protein PKK10_17280, partial [Woeseiaceae bacterium]|nr:hypothetical protein [Woeseiaceae bacterium]
MSARVCSVLRSGTATARFTGQLVDLIARQVPVALRLSELGRAPVAAANYERFCRILAREISAAGLSPANVELTLDAKLLQPEYAWDRRQCHLGRGPVNFLLDEGALADASQMLQLWRLRVEDCIRVAFWPLAASACPLLSAERARHVLPGTGLQAPAQSAWILASFDVSRHLGQDGEVDYDMMQYELSRLLDSADALHDATRWPTPAMRQDAWFNRRVAVRVRGLADFMQRLGYDPGCHRTLAHLHRLLGDVRKILLRRSQTLARRSETLPAIAASSPCLGMAPGPSR